MRTFVFVVLVTVLAGRSYADSAGCPVVEVAIGKLKPQTDQAAFLRDSKELDNHIKKMKGFISRRFYKIESTGQWMDIVCWRSESEAKKAAEEVHKIPACNSYLGHYTDKTDLFVHGVAQQ